ncbi:hypothetical protein C8J57DRAFT_1285744 [Mycena rebaudengoi]|nr:hypothetical protein C8J57DRAFT_1285744 [Mycena rebaudengoi]
MQSPMYTPQAIRRVTVRQLLAATQLHSSAPFQIDGKDFKNAILVGNPHDIKASVESGYLSFIIDDGTGRIRVQQWTERSQRAEQLLKSSYVRVVGELHTYMAVNYFRADNVLAAPDPHEVYAHILGAIADTITYHCGAPPPHHDSTSRPASLSQPLVPQLQNGDSPDSDLSNPMDLMTLNPGPGPPGSHSLDIQGFVNNTPLSLEARLSQSPRYPALYTFTTLNCLQQEIIQCLKDLARGIQCEPPDDWEGISIQSLCDLVLVQRPDVSESELGENLLALFSGGYIYKPLVESHCRLTED